MKEYTLCGYRIGYDVYVDIFHKRIIYLSSDKRNADLQVAYLRRTMMRLLIYILDNALYHPVPDEDIMTNVWDVQGLSSSRQRLWQVIKDLNRKLDSFGIGVNFIKRVKNQGYTINKENITLIYLKKCM
ncbi:winged helix-turn-helix domain-containing protein (plasmid) [Serratia sp. L9]|uniref:winged helix-turn-helix domain-containing protein n=1 Tax=Serratia sp. L9 TaxID=3423946 RepID=UPI003D66E613